MSRRRQAPPADFGTHQRIATALVDTTGSLSGAWKMPNTPERAMGYCFLTSAENRSACEPKLPRPGGPFSSLPNSQSRLLTQRSTVRSGGRFSDGREDTATARPDPHRQCDVSTPAPRSSWAEPSMRGRAPR